MPSGSTRISSRDPASDGNAWVRVLRRCKWYRESDHILTLIFSMFSGGNKLQDVNRLGQDDALKRVLGSDRIPHALTTIGKFLWRFGNDQQDKQRHGLAELRDTTAAIQQDAFAMLPRERRKVATLDWDSSIHEVYGQKKEGRGLCVRQYVELQRVVRDPGGDPAMCCIWGCGKAIGTPATGPRKCCTGTIERVSKHFRQLRMRADSGYYSQALVKICEQREVEFFIVAKQHRNLMNAVREIQDSNWKSFAGSDLSGRRSGPTAAPAASEPETEDCDTAQTPPGSKERPTVAGMMFRRSEKRGTKHAAT